MCEEGGWVAAGRFSGNDSGAPQVPRQPRRFELLAPAQRRHVAVCTVADKQPPVSSGASPSERLPVLEAQEQGEPEEPEVPVGSGTAAENAT